MAPPVPRRGRGRPSTTSRSQIVDAARRLIEAEGADNLTIRRLAGDMGIGAATLYRHVRDREDLLILVLDEALQTVPLPGASGSPHDQIVAASVAMRDALASWPWAADVLSADGFLGRLDDRSIRVVELILAGATASGSTTDEAVELFRTIWSLCVGDVMIRARSAGSTPQQRSSYPGFSSRDPRALPHLADVGPRWPEIAARDTYERGVRALVHGFLHESASGKDAF